MATKHPPGTSYGSGTNMWLRLCVLAAAVALITALLCAQGKKGEDANTRSVQGTVTNAEDAPVDGAVVHLENTKTQQIRSFITQERGAYYFHGLSTDVDYKLHAVYLRASSATKTLSSFDSRKQAIINLKLNK